MSVHFSDASLEPDIQQRLAGEVGDRFLHLEGEWRVSIHQPLGRPFFEILVRTPSGAQLVRRCHLDRPAEASAWTDLLKTLLPAGEPEPSSPAVETAAATAAQA